MNSAIGRWFKAGALLFVTTLIVAACEGTAGLPGEPGAPGEPGGVPPQVTDQIGDLMLVAGASQTIDLSDHFLDPDAEAGDRLSFAAESSNAASVSATVANATLTVRATAVVGTATVTVTATDGDGLTNRAKFDVTVEAAPAENQRPVAVGTIPEVDVQVGASETVDVAAYFNDPDGDTLTYTATTAANENDATVSVTGSVVTIAGKVVGRALITVTASDPGNLSVDQTIEVDVAAAPSRGAAPQPLGSIMAVNLRAGEAGTPIDVSNYFHHPDGATMTYTASSSAATVATASIPTGTSMLTIIGQRPMAQATATVTVTASDPDGQTAKQPISVTVAADDTPAPVDPKTNLTVSKATDLDIDPYLSADQESTDYELHSDREGTFTVELKKGSTSIWTIKPVHRGTADAMIRHKTTGTVVTTIKVTVPNRMPVINTETPTPAPFPLTETTYGKVNLNGDAPGVKAYAVALGDLAGYFKDADANDKLTFTIDSEHDSVLVKMGGTCAATPCTVKVDVLEEIGPATFDLSVIAKDPEGATSPAKMFEVLVDDPRTQAYKVYQNSKGFRAITVGDRRDVKHDLTVQGYDSTPDAAGGEVTTLWFIDTFIAKLVMDAAGATTTTGLADTEADVIGTSTVATGATDLVLVDSAPAVLAIDAPVTQRLVVTSTGAVKASDLSKLTTANAMLKLEVVGSGSGMVKFDYYVWADLNTADNVVNGSPVLNPKWHMTSATLKVTVKKVT